MKYTPPPKKYQIGETVSFRWQPAIWNGNAYDWKEIISKGVIVNVKLTGAEDCGYMWHYFVKYDSNPGAHPADVLERDIV